MLDACVSIGDQLALTQFTDHVELGNAGASVVAFDLL
jgi:hypothetical protein